jgi:Leucine-rich repeat (LRR) protein
VLLEHYIARNLSVSALDLSKNDFGGFYLDKGKHKQRYVVTPGGASALARAIEKNNTLRTVNLSSIDMGGKADREGVTAVASMMKRTLGNNLTRLDLSCNSLSPKDGLLVADGLRVNTVLRWLNLASNDLRGKGAKRIAAALLENSTLETLILASNKVLRKDVARAFAEALSTNETLREIDLSNSNWEKDFQGSDRWGGDPAGFVKILSAAVGEFGVSFTSAIRRLHLGNNRISRKRREELRALCVAKQIELSL